MPLVRVLASLLALGAALPAYASTPTTTIITACISKVDGFTRIVPSPASCNKRFETVLQFNQAGPAGPQGPVGPTGPQGPPGSSNNAPFLVRTVIVPAGGTAAQNGAYLLEIINAVESVASPTNPYLIQLDAGYFDVGAGAVIYPGISLRGAGMVSTFITSSNTALYFINQVDATGISFSLSDMTVTATSNPQGRPVASPNITNVVFDHLHLLAPVEGLTGLGTQVPGAALLITNSIINGPLNLSNLYADPTVRMKVIATQVDSFQINGGTSPATLACFAAYNASLVPYSNACD